MLTEVDLKMIQHGYEKEYKLINPSDELLQVASELNKQKIENSSIKKITLQEALIESEAFMKGHFIIHKVPHCSTSKLQSFLRERRQLSLEAMISEYNNFGKEIDPYNLPIVLHPTDSYLYGYLGEFGINFATDEFLSQAKVIFDSIVLSETITNLTPKTLSHEVAHSQLNSKKGSIKSYYNYEIIPIFIDYLHSFEKDESLVEYNLEKKLRYHDIARNITILRDYNENRKQISLPQAIIYTMYLESELKATLLFEIYLNSDKKVQNDILNYIQAIFNGNKTVEGLLDKYNITLQDGSNFLQKQYIKSESSNAYNY